MAAFGNDDGHTRGDPALAVALEVLRCQRRGERQAEVFSRMADVWRNLNEIAGLEARLGG
jgi:hypothetical protein